MSDPVILKRGVLNGPIALVRTVDNVAQDLTGLKIRCAFRRWAERYGTATTETLLLALDSDTDAELYVDPNPLLGKVWLELTVAQVALLCPENIRTKVAAGFELYDDAAAEVLVYDFCEVTFQINPEIPR